MNTAARPWTGLEIRRCPALARTHLIVFGAVDADRLAEVRAATAAALAEGHKVTFDLRNIATPAGPVLDELHDLAEESSER